MLSSRKTSALVLTLGGGLLLISAGHLPRGNKNSPAAPTQRVPFASDSVALAASMYRQCARLSSEAKTRCYSRPLDSLASLGEVRRAMTTLGRLGELDVAVKRDGHVYAHAIGIAAGKRGGDIAATFATCDPGYQSGCYHGVIQAYFAAASQIGPREVRALCEPFRAPGADQWIRFQCVHGMGHGLEMVYDHNLPKALGGCDFLAEEWDRSSCYGGAFMENIVNVTMPAHPGHDMEMHMSMPMQPGAAPFKAVDSKDPLYPCSSLGAKYQEACYEMQTSVMLYLNHGDIGAAAKSCDTAPFAMRFVCYQSLGRDISSYALQDFAKSQAMCALGTARYQPWCYFGLDKNFIDLNARASDGISFCKYIKGDFNKMKCYEGVGEEIATLRNDLAGRRSLCDGSEPDYVDACLFGAGLTPAAPISLARLNASARGG